MQQQEAGTAAAAAAGAVAEQQQTASSSMADLREDVHTLHHHLVQYTSFLDSLHGVSWSPLVDDTYGELKALMDYRLSGDRALGWLVCIDDITLRSTLATSIVAYLESVLWASLTAAGLYKLDTSFNTVLQACDILGRLLAGRRASLHLYGMEPAAAVMEKCCPGQ